MRERKSDRDIGFSNPSFCFELSGQGEELSISDCQPRHFRLPIANFRFKKLLSSFEQIGNWQSEIGNG
jgi:hypothetical protein